MIKKAIFCLVAALLIAASAMLLGEAALRLAGLFDKNRGLRNAMGIPDTRYHHSFKPNTSCRLSSSVPGEYDTAVRINRYGFRGPDISLEKAPGVKRVLVMGDSFTFGVGAEEDETIPRLMERYLNDSGARVEVINAGFGGYSPLLHYLRMKDEYLALKPDLVLYLFGFSDLVDDWRAERHLVYDKAGNIVRCDATYLDGKKDWWAELRSHSVLCSFIHRKLVRSIEKIRILGVIGYLKAKLEGKRAKALIIAKEKGEGGADPINYDPYLMIRGRDRLPYIRSHFARSALYLDRIRSGFASEGATTMLVIYPFGVHVGPDQWGQGRVYWAFERGKTYDDRYAFGLLEDYAKERGIHCINLLPDFLANRGIKLFFDMDGHFTPEANKVAARAIVNDPELRRALGIAP